MIVLGTLKKRKYAVWYLHEIDYLDITEISELK